MSHDEEIVEPTAGEISLSDKVGTTYVGLHIKHWAHCIIVRVLSIKHLTSAQWNIYSIKPPQNS